MEIQEELAYIKTRMEEMFSLVLNNCRTSFSYYLSDCGYDKDLVIDDDKVNQYEQEIESFCMQVLLKERAFSGDLRQVSGYLKMVENIERIGDNAYDIKWMADDIKQLKKHPKINGMEELVALVEVFLTDSMQAFVKNDMALADDIIHRDDLVDKRYWAMVMELAELDERKIILPLDSVLQAHIAKYLERMADQATNISEWVVYIVSGYHKNRIII